MITNYREKKTPGDEVRTPLQEVNPVGIRRGHDYKLTQNAYKIKRLKAVQPQRAPFY
jgi:hypothetical protein